MANLLEERLRSNSNAFEGLLSLIPAKYYYDDQTQEQWKAKKKSKTQSKEDKQKKLDPEQQGENSLSTLEVMKEREKDAKPVVLPGEKLKKLKDEEKEREQEVKEDEPSEEIDGTEDIDVVFDDEGNEINLKEDEEEEEEEEHQEEPEEPEKSPAVEEESEEEHKEGSVEQENKESQKSQNKPNLEALRSKLQAKIQDMKERRRAPGTRVRGAPSSREAIIEERKQRLDLRKQKNDSQKQQNNKSGDESESDEDDSDIETQPPTKKAKIEVDANDIMYQNIEFDDGNKITSNLQHLKRGPKKKGPAKNDIRAHLKLLEAKKAKLESKEEMDQINAKEKEKWQRAMLQAEGIKLKDDEKLLRKALKRKEAKKRRSEQEWRDRKLAVTTSKADKQKRREENLKIRKQNKGVKRSKQQKMKSAYKGNSTMVKRAGFEGRLKSGKKK
ncbi:hypothetical protein ZYGR_0P00370 [Zygosaccharomyces rouxii]|uniref:ZYRO0E00990p n=2 Tax=Zygosaccharomyces rouxii TaxID=4956 RepID=C5E3X4_ZYGRC|nr:uncharacterized protein ZYRO0E00990g [Zygosaccharomyces rouxii]KAH9198402.1 surfeit locus protein 6-domain-containing protein [Zygosaccharomyces rouxii]GAV49394.1 hypothetical protein ZYGR_0P00370 [Zygosaccharomyces rouxii]CAR30735.1 ZYRO0E00990p [Zygosaccharomyces rouxii]